MHATTTTLALLCLALPAASAFLPPTPAPHMASPNPRAAARTRRFINSDGPVTDVDVAGKLDPSRCVVMSLICLVCGCWVDGQGQAPPVPSCAGGDRGTEGPHVCDVVWCHNAFLLTLFYPSYINHTDSKWDVEVTLNGVTKTVQIAEGTSLLDAAEQVRII